MKLAPLIIALSIAVVFGCGLTVFYWHGASQNRYQIVSGGQAGIAFRLDTHSGDTWLLTSTGEEKLILPPAPGFSLEVIKELHQKLRQSNPNDTPATLRDFAIKMHNGTGTNLYDAAALRSSE